MIRIFVLISFLSLSLFSQNVILNPNDFNIDEILKRPYNSEVPFGSTGKYLWATSPQGWGFPEGVHFYLLTNIKAYDLYIVVGNERVKIKNAIYYPSHVEMEGDFSGIYVRGSKFITSDDILVSLLKVKNESKEDKNIRVVAFSEIGFTKISENLFGFEQFYHGIHVHVRAKMEGNNKFYPNGIYFEGIIKGGEEKDFKFAMAFDLNPNSCEKKLDDFLRKKEPLNEHISQYIGWFKSEIPYFDCPDKWFRKMWYHRYYLLKKNLSETNVGFLKYLTFSEGRWRSPWYANTISYGAPHVIREARWLKSKKYYQGYILNFVENINENGIYRNFVAPFLLGDGYYTEWITSAIWDSYLVRMDKDFLKEVVEKMATNVEGWLNECDKDKDYLLEVYDHFATGMEWQPSFFFFSGYDINKPEILERVDLTSYNYGNASATSLAFKEIGDIEKSKKYLEIAEKIKKSLLSNMWDNRTHFFYSLRAKDNEKALVKEIVGFYPFYFNLPPMDSKEYVKAWEYLQFDKEFWTPFPPASTAKSCPAYSQTNVWGVQKNSGTDVERVTVCYWNGPTWPHANSIVISALANTLRNYKQKYVTKNTLFNLLESFTKVQFKDFNYDFPYTAEFYNGETGEWYGHRDYNHSTYNDMIIQYIVGLVPRNDKIIEIDPLIPENKWEYFCLDNLPYHSHQLTIVWDKPDGNDQYNDGDEGFTLYIDGKKILNVSSLKKIYFDYSKIEREKK